MDRTKYEAAHQLYQEQDFRKAARLFLEAADEGTPLENGMAYHGAGNCFMRLKRYHDAIVVYEQALRDDSYQKRGTIENNLANAYLQNGDLSQAIAHFEAALNESSMHEPYKCYQGLAHAHFELRSYEQAALAYKNAALDERNPNPGAALVNLGLCMMALGRPRSAAESYSAALGVDGYNNRGKALANLGMAYYACEDYGRAQRALEEAQVMHHYQLSPAAAEVLAASQAKVRELDADDEADDNDDDDVVDGDSPDGQTPAPQPDSGQTAVIPRLDETLTAPAAAPAPAPVWADEPAPAQEGVAQTTSAAAQATVAAEARPADPDAARPEDGPAATEEPKQAEESADATSGSKRKSSKSRQSTDQIGSAEGVDDFYALSEKEIARQRKLELRKSKGIWRWLKPVIIVLIVLAVLAGGAFAVIKTGFGVPSVDTTVSRLFTAYNAGGAYEDYWVAGAQNVTRQMAALPVPSDHSIDKIDRGILSSTARVSVTSNGTTKLTFDVKLERSGLGWKVSSITGQY